MNTFQLSGEPRTDTGKKATKADRVAGRIPCVAYGRKGAEHFTVTPKDVRKLVFTGVFNLVDLSVGGNAQQVILKAVQYHPTTEAIEHIDFVKVEAGHPLKIEIPLHTKGVSEGVKGGGRLIQSVRKIKVKTDPSNLVDELFVDISGLGLGDAIRVRDIEVPEGVQIMANGAVPVAMVEIPRALRSAATAAAKDEEAATPEAEA
ncbi:MAG: 50S ribosomal protein L25 [Saprospiraceae bacterium]